MKSLNNEMFELRNNFRTESEKAIKENLPILVEYLDWISEDFSKNACSINKKFDLGWSDIYGWSKYVNGTRCLFFKSQNFNFLVVKKGEGEYVVVDNYLQIEDGEKYIQEELLPALIEEDKMWTAFLDGLNDEFSKAKIKEIEISHKPICYLTFKKFKNGKNIQEFKNVIIRPGFDFFQETAKLSDFENIVMQIGLSILYANENKIR